MAVKATKKNTARKTAQKKEKAPADSFDVKIYSATGKEVGTVAVPQKFFGLPWNNDLVHQVATSMESNARTPIAHTKDRGEVSGGGKKPWKQKGTGRARHGSIRSPIWVGGGIAHGPRKEKNYARKVNKKMKAKAFFTVLSQKMRDGEIIFVDSFALHEPKTARAKEILLALSKAKGYEGLAEKKKNAALVTTPIKDMAVEKSFRNFGNVSAMEVRNANVLDLLRYKYVVVADPKASLAFFENKLSKH